MLKRYGGDERANLQHKRSQTFTPHRVHYILDHGNLNWHPFAQLVAQAMDREKPVPSFFGWGKNYQF